MDIPFLNELRDDCRFAGKVSVILAAARTRRANP
jgi:hypothetical protein